MKELNIKLMGKKKFKLNKKFINKYIRIIFNHLYKMKLMNKDSNKIKI